MKENKGERSLFGLVIPIMFLLACVILLFPLRGGFSKDYLLILLSRSLVLSIITVGAVFVFTVGAFGISLGASTLFGVSLGAAVYETTGSIALSFVVSVGAPALSCVISSVLSTFFNLPAYVTAALMLALLGSAARVTLESRGGEIFTGLSGNTVFDSLRFRAIFFAFYMLLCVFLFHFCPVGRKQKALGDDRHKARLMGVSRRWYSAVAFLVAGLGVGLGAFLILCSGDSVSKSSVSDLGFNIIFAILLGGMSLSGGSGSRLSSAVMGSFSAIFISEILYEVFGHKMQYLGLSQMIRGGILLIFMVISSKNIQNGGKNAG